jgi:hypothetical protein
MDGKVYRLEQSYWVKIYISGPIEMIDQCCREFVLDGLCVNVTETQYIFTHGEQQGATIELINYPVYPKTPEEIWDTAIDLANFILDNTHQGSYTVMDPDQAITFDRRKIFALPPED